jgi:hypothetical protein
MKWGQEGKTGERGRGPRKVGHEEVLERLEIHGSNLIVQKPGKKEL